MPCCSAAGKCRRRLGFASAEHHRLLVYAKNAVIDGPRMIEGMQGKKNPFKPVDRGANITDSSFTLKMQCAQKV